MPFFHGIILRAGKWLRVISGAELRDSDVVSEVFEGGPYVPAFLEHFFSGEYRVEVRKIHKKWFKGNKSLDPQNVGLVSGEVLRFSNASDQYTIRIKGDTQGWLGAFNDIGLIIGNSRKMSKRLIELVRLACTWTYRDASDPLAIEVIAYDGPETDVDGISAISEEFFFECVDSNRNATREWRRSMKAKVRNGKLTVVSLRVLTPEGLIKGNALVLPKWMMNGYDVRTFQPNIKPEISTTGWYWGTVEPSYGALPVRSDDLTHSIYRGVEGLYDDGTLMKTLNLVLDEFDQDLRSGKRTEWMERLADHADEILHDDDASDRYGKNGLVGKIQIAVAKLAALGVPLTASQTLMFLSVNGLKNQFLGDNKKGQVWADKTRHWFPVPWAYAAHIMTAEVLREFGFHIPDSDKGFYHEATHCFVVPGDYFAKNYDNHGGYDLDDTVKVHIRRMIMPDGTTKLVAFLLRNPNDFGEWSMIEVDDFGPVYHRFGTRPPAVDYNKLCSAVPQWSELKSSLEIGQLPAIANPPQIGDVFSPEDEDRVLTASLIFPAGVGGTVIPKMIWYAVTGRPIQSLCAPNEDIIDVLQQGQGSIEDTTVIQSWIDKVFADLKAQVPEMDPFWFHTRLPAEAAEEWPVADRATSTWMDLHIKRETVIRTKIEGMVSWLNDHVTMPDILSGVTWTQEELATMQRSLSKIQADKRASMGWVDRFCDLLRQSDEKHGEERTDRKILLLAYAALKAKEANPRANHDQWLYSFAAKADDQPSDWFIRALSRLQDGTYNW
jgi:hypothetical protein